MKNYIKFLIWMTNSIFISHDLTTSIVSSLSSFITNKLILLHSPQWKSNWALEYLVDALPRQSTTFEVLALQLFLKCLEALTLRYEFFFSYSVEGIIWLSQVYLVSHKYFQGIRTSVMNFRVPLDLYMNTFFFAFANEFGETIENMIRNMSVEG